MNYKLFCKLAGLLFSIFLLVYSNEAIAKEKPIDSPYCEGFTFSLHYLVIPGFGVCAGNEDVQGSLELVAPWPVGIELGLTHTLSPRSQSSMYYGVRGGVYSMITTSSTKFSVVAGYNFGSFFIEFGPALISTVPPPRRQPVIVSTTGDNEGESVQDYSTVYSDETENVIAFDFTIGWD